MIDLKLPVFLVALFVMSGCAEQSCTGSCQVSVESDHQMYRYRLDGGNGILEKKGGLRRILECGIRETRTQWIRGCQCFRHQR